MKRWNCRFPVYIPKSPRLHCTFTTSPIYTIYMYVCVCVCVCVRVCVCVCINCCFNGNEVGHYIAQARRFTVAKQYQSSFLLNLYISDQTIFGIFSVHTCFKGLLICMCILAKILIFNLHSIVCSVPIVQVYKHSIKTLRKVSWSWSARANFRAENNWQFLVTNNRMFVFIINCSLLYQIISNHDLMFL